MNELVRILKREYITMLTHYTANNGLNFPDNETIARVWLENAGAACTEIMNDIKEANEAFLCNGKPTPMLREVANVSIRHAALELAKKAAN